LDSIQAERNELQAKLTVAERRLAEVAEFEAASRDRLSEISNLTGQVEAREREVSSLHVQIQTLQAAMGEKQVLEAQLEQVRSQLKDASATITKLQTQQKTSGALEVDIDPDPVTDDTFRPENEILHGDLSEALKEIEELKAILAKTKAKLPENVSVDSSLDSPESVSVDSPENVSESVSKNSRVEPIIQSDSQSASKSKRQKVALAK